MSNDLNLYMDHYQTNAIGTHPPQLVIRYVYVGTTIVCLTIRIHLFTEYYTIEWPSAVQSSLFGWYLPD